MIASQDFEGDFPGDWFAFDNVDDSGEYYWGKRDCRPYSGDYSGWAIGDGADGAANACGSNYPNNAQSWLAFGPISLEDATAAEMNFALWLKTRDQGDAILWGASVDGEWFYSVDDPPGLWGDSDGWVDWTVDLSTAEEIGNVLGEPQVYVALIFMTSASGRDPEGCYVDDIVLRKCTSTECASGVGAAAEPVGVQLTAVPGLKKFRIPKPVGLGVGPLSSIDRGGRLP